MRRINLTQRKGIIKMKEWVENHRSFEVGEEVVIAAKDYSVPNVTKQNGKTGSIHSYADPICHTYYVHLESGCLVIVSPFEIEPIKPEPVEE